METEIKLKYMLDDIVELNEIIERGRKAMDERNRIRKKMVELMECYVDEMSEMQ